MAYPIELRKKAINAYETSEHSQETTAKLFGISITTFKKWLKKKRNGEDLAPPSTRSGRPKKITPTGTQTIKKLVESNPSITLSELSKAYYKKHKVKLSASMLCRELKELNLRYKKLSLYAVEKDTDEILKKKENYLLGLSDIPVENLLFLDEAGANLQMAPRYGRGYKGERVAFAAPYQRGNKITMMSVISVYQIEAAMYGTWSADGEIFVEFVEKVLRPILKPYHVLVMDNVSFHKSKQVQTIVNDVGARIIFLPPYHPELNPIEEMWSKVKTCLRKLSARTLNDFQSAIKNAFEMVTPSDLLGWFQHSGY